MLDILSDRIVLIRDLLGDYIIDVITLAVDFNSFKIKVILADGSTLRIEEHYSRNRLGRYAYYWLGGNNNLLIGWDDAPHHNRLPNFPHHKHSGQQERREPSYETTLEQVLAVVKQKLSTP